MTSNFFTFSSNTGKVAEQRCREHFCHINNSRTPVKGDWIQRGSSHIVLKVDRETKKDELGLGNPSKCTISNISTFFYSYWAVRNKHCFPLSDRTSKLSKCHFVIFVTIHPSNRAGNRFVANFEGHTQPFFSLHLFLVAKHGGPVTHTGSSLIQTKRVYRGVWVAKWGVAALRCGVLKTVFASKLRPCDQLRFHWP